MSQKMRSVLLHLVRWFPIVLLSFIVVEPSLRGAVLGVIQDTGDAWPITQVGSFANSIGV